MLHGTCNSLIVVAWYLQQFDCCCMIFQQFDCCCRIYLTVWYEEWHSKTTQISKHKKMQIYNIFMWWIKDCYSWEQRTDLYLCIYGHIFVYLRSYISFIAIYFCIYGHILPIGQFNENCFWAFHRQKKKITTQVVFNL